MSESYEETVEVIAATGSALLCDFAEGQKWVPKSLIDEDEGDINKSSTTGDTGVISIPEWFATKEGIV